MTKKTAQPVYLCARGPDLPKPAMSDLEVAWLDHQASRKALADAVDQLARYRGTNPNHRAHTRVKHSEAIERVQQTRAHLTILSRQAVGADPHALPEDSHH